jgi:amidase
LTGGGIDISAEVAVRVNVLKGRTWPRPWIETPDAWVTYGHGCTLEQAVRLATSDMTTLLADKLSISREEAFQLIGARGDAHLGQAAQMDFAMTAYIVMPKIVPISV